LETFFVPILSFAEEKAKRGKISRDPSRDRKSERIRVARRFFFDALGDARLLFTICEFMCLISNFYDIFF
jgi:hypothetical protein